MFNPEILYRFTHGEQREVEVTLKPVGDTSLGFTYEAVVIEGDNTADQAEAPLRRRFNGVQTVLEIRVPLARGVWSASNTYLSGEWVRNAAGDAFVLKGAPSGADPVTDGAWEEYVPDKIFVRFPDTLIDGWAQLPRADTPVYGFFGVRATETTGEFPQTYKPLAGLIELGFSPTHIVN